MVFGSPPPRWGGFVILTSFPGVAASASTPGYRTLPLRGNQQFFVTASSRFSTMFATIVSAANSGLLSLSSGLLSPTVSSFSASAG